MYRAQMFEADVLIHVRSGTNVAEYPSHLTLPHTHVSVLCILFVLKRRDVYRFASRDQLDTMFRRKAS